MRTKILAGNWKMHGTVEESAILTRKIVDELPDTPYRVVLCPPFTSLLKVSEILRDSKLYLGAQDTHWEREGAFTGEISPLMLRELGVRYVIVGHSERRKYFHETDEMINKKLKAALSFGLIPIFCVGETLEEREKGLEKEVVKRQLFKGLQGISREETEKIVIAYEPVWAIGTGKTASREDAEEMHKEIRRLIDVMHYGTGEKVTILYGGSVKPENIRELTMMPNIDGALVGGASIKAESFLQIVKNAVP